MKRVLSQRLRESRRLNPSSAINVATVAAANTVFAQRLMGKWLGHRVLALHPLGRSWEQCRSIKDANNLKGR